MNEPSRFQRTKLVVVTIDIGERFFAILLAVPFLLSFVAAMSAHPSFVVIAVSEMLTVGLVLVRRWGRISTSPLAVASAFAGTALPLLARPGGIALAPAILSTSLMVGGLCLSVLSKLYLNRSFGLIAANRGVKMGGPYRLVRHPMYLGYIISEIGFLTASFSVINLVIYVAAWSIQLVRMHQEESILCEDPNYRQFASRVKSRLIPGVY